MISESEVQKATLDKGVSGSIFVIITLFGCCHDGTHCSHFGIEFGKTSDIGVRIK